jgi:hypothetical protein
MPSELKSATARTNGAKSRGPKSPETRAKSSLNALKHGFTTRKTIVLECENEADFQELLAEYAATYQPACPVEKDLVDEMVAARWRMQRMLMIEAALLDSEMDREPPFGEPEPTDPGYQIAAAFRRLVDESHALSFASRYESRLHRLHERSHRTLRELQQSRKQQIAEAVSPAPAQPEPPLPAAAEPAPVPTQAAEPSSPSPKPQLVRSRRKVKNEPKPVPPTAAAKPVQRRAHVRHRGVISYIRSKTFRRLKQFKATTLA